MIKDNIIRADLPDPEKETELYTLGFSQPYSEYTYEDPNNLRFIYKYTKEEDRIEISNIEGNQHILLLQAE
ncbi:hypothetical protein C1645_840306 [Glomus cerebriforme]|uniref:Uncharacterized protein n=1 Tax=Glomus cerebriforme TaxID=658196 RepID=A0A397S6I4_9GLOM|nr:hypothetical protein C1645_840306 [Glomus cerebriforme]